MSGVTSMVPEAHLIFGRLLYGDEGGVPVGHLRVEEGQSMLL